MRLVCDAFLLRSGAGSAPCHTACENRIVAFFKTNRRQRPVSRGKNRGVWERQYEFDVVPALFPIKIRTPAH